MRHSEPRTLNPELFNITQDSTLCRVIQNLLSNRRYYVEPNNERSIWRLQKAPNDRFTVFWACRACWPCGPAAWLALFLTKAGDVETNPGPTTLNKKVWICDICHKQIHVRKQISIRCNRIEHWVHLRCAGIRQAQ